MAPASRGALVVYALAVVAEVAGIVVGARTLSTSGNGVLTPALVATVVGVHFLPFA